MRKIYLLTIAAVVFSLSAGSNVQAANATLGATIGKVQAVTGSTITAADLVQGNISGIVVDKTTKIIGANRKILSLASIEPNDLVAVVSSSSATPGKALRIYVQNASGSAQVKKEVVLGTVTTVKNSTLTITSPIKGSQVYTVVVTSKTQIKLQGITDVKLASLQTGTKVVVIGSVDSHGTITALRVHVIAGQANGLTNQTPASGSAAATLLHPSVKPTTAPATSPGQTGASSSAASH